MTSEFERDLSAAKEQIDAGRGVLIGVLDGLSDADLDQSRRGGWSVGHVLEHVIESEWLYARLVQHLQERPVQGDAIAGALASVADACERLAGSRQALLAALEGVDEEPFYRLAAVGHEEYSILSVFENQANHDREHAEQIRSILAAS